MFHSLPSYYRQESLAGKSVSCRFTLADGTVSSENTVALPDELLGLNELEAVTIDVPGCFRSRNGNTDSGH